MEDRIAMEEKEGFDDYLETLSLSGSVALYEGDDDESLVVPIVSYDELIAMIEKCEQKWDSSSKVATTRQVPPMKYYEQHHGRSVRLQQHEELQKDKRVASREMSSQLSWQSPIPPSTAPSSQSSWQSTPVVSSTESNTSPESGTSPKSNQLLPESAMPAEKPIDPVPFESIEVPDSDMISVVSGLTTQMNSSLAEERRYGNVPASQTPEPFGYQAQQRPVDKEYYVNASRQQIVRDVLVELLAASGQVKSALYTGPMNEKGELTGFGYFLFKKSGDEYKGEVRRGKMHGRGTYTFAKSSRKHPNRPKELRGIFKNNAFIGRDPASAMPAICE